MALTGHSQGPELYIRTGKRLYECIVRGIGKYGIMALPVLFRHWAGFIFIEKEVA